MVSSAICAEKRRIDLDGDWDRIVSVALILQGIREGAAKRRNRDRLAKLLEFQRVTSVGGPSLSELDGV
jgi:hypothetical protein